VTPDYGFLFISLNLNQAVTRNNLHFEWEGGEYVDIPAGRMGCMSSTEHPSLTIYNITLYSPQK
jgi:hypothetical protein